MKRTLHWFFLATSLAVVSGCGGPSARSDAGASEHALAELTPDQVEAKLAEKSGSFFVFDANSKDVFDKEHVVSAKWVASDGVKASDLPPNKDATLVFYCMNDH